MLKTNTETLNSSRFFLDTEFIEDGRTIELISIGIVCSDGREYYAVNSDCDLSKANSWVKENVIPHLPAGGSKLWKEKALIRGEVAEFLGAGGFCTPLPWRGLNKLKRWLFGDLLPEPLAKTVDKVEWLRPKTYYKTTYRIRGGRPEPKIWAYYGSYDWVALCQLFGEMVDLPSGFPMYIRDLKQLCDMLGSPELPAQVSRSHNALEDAHYNKLIWEFLQKHSLDQQERIDS